jgi:hypothetical protein
VALARCIDRRDAHFQRKDFDRAIADYSEAIRIIQTDRRSALSFSMLPTASANLAGSRLARKAVEAYYRRAVDGIERSRVIRGRHRGGLRRSLSSGHALRGPVGLTTRPTDLPASASEPPANWRAIQNKAANPYAIEIHMSNQPRSLWRVRPAHADRCPLRMGLDSHAA